MFRKNYLPFFLAIVLFSISSIAVFGQNAPVTGRVELTKADGSKVPVAGALVEVFRVDQKVKLPSAKTDKKGFFAFAGVPLGGRYILVVSGAGIAPAIYPNVAPGTDNIVISVTEGDGKRWTEDEAKQVLASSRSTGNTGGGEANVSEEEKKRQEEIKKQNEAIMAENERIKKSNEIINASLKDGNAAFNQKNYDLAIAKYEEGYNAAPTFTPSAAVFLNNMAAALINRADATYRTINNENRTQVLESVKNDTTKAAEKINMSLEMLKNETPKDEKQKADFETLRNEAIRRRKDAFYLMVRTGADRTRNAEAITAFKEYLETEKVPAEKLKVQLLFAQVLFDLNEVEIALSVYEKVLEENPDNLDALAGAGFALVSIGYINGEDKAKFQLGANYLQRFIDLAPDTHKDKANAREAVDTLKKSYKITPQKMPAKRN